MQTNTRNRGFASMDSQKQREIARKGGRAAHEKGTAHEFTTEEARAAGKKGGERVSLDRNHMSRIGKIGGKSSAGRRPAGPSHDEEGASPSSRGAYSVGLPERLESGRNERVGPNDEPPPASQRSVESVR